MKDHVESSHLTKVDSFRPNRVQVIALETRFKIHTNISNVETASPKTIQNLKMFYQFCGKCKISLFTYHLKETKLKITFVCQFFESISEIIKNKI